VSNTSKIWDILEVDILFEIATESIFWVNSLISDTVLTATSSFAVVRETNEDSQDAADNEFGSSVLIRELNEVSIVRRTDCFEACSASVKEQL